MSSKKVDADALAREAARLIAAISDASDRPEFNAAVQKVSACFVPLQQELKERGTDAGIQRHLEDLMTKLEAEKTKWFAKESRDERNLIILLIGMMVLALALVLRLMLAQK